MSDFGEWVLDDLDGCIKVQRDRVSWVKADRHAVRYIGKKTSIGDFQHSFIVCFEDAYVEDELNRGLIRLWEIRNDWENRAWIYARKTGMGWTIHFEQKYKGDDLGAYHSERLLVFGQRYVVEPSRIGDRYHLKVLREDSSVLVDMGWIDGVEQVYDWIWLASTIKSRRNNKNWSTGYIESIQM